METFLLQEQKVAEKIGKTDGTKTQRQVKKKVAVVVENKNITFEMISMPHMTEKFNSKEQSH